MKTTGTNGCSVLCECIYCFSCNLTKKRMESYSSWCWCFQWKYVNYLTLVLPWSYFIPQDTNDRLQLKKIISILEVGLTGSFFNVLREVILNWNLCSTRIKGLKSKDLRWCNLIPTDSLAQRQKNVLSHSAILLLQLRNHLSFENLYY